MLILITRFLNWLRPQLTDSLNSGLKWTAERLRLGKKSAQVVVGLVFCPPASPKWWSFILVKRGLPYPEVLLKSWKITGSICILCLKIDETEQLTFTRAILLTTGKWLTIGYRWLYSITTFITSRIWRRRSKYSKQLCYAIWIKSDTDRYVFDYLMINCLHSLLN